MENLASELTAVPPADAAVADTGRDRTQEVSNALEILRGAWETDLEQCRRFGLRVDELERGLESAGARADDAEERAADAEERAAAAERIAEEASERLRATEQELSAAQAQLERTSAELTALEAGRGQLLQTVEKCLSNVEVMQSKTVQALRGALDGIVPGGDPVDDDLPPDLMAGGEAEVIDLTNRADLAHLDRKSRFRRRHKGAHAVHS